MSILSARPKNIVLGVRDASKRVVPYEAPSYPVLMPHIFVLAKKGKTDYTIPAPFNKSGIALKFGDELFDENSEYFTHQTLALNTALEVGAQCAITRVVAPDAKRADAVLYANVVEADIPNYERNLDGTVKKDDNGEPVENGTISGYKITFVIKQNVFENRPTMADDNTLPGLGGGTLYPLLWIPAAAVGKWYNNVGFSFYARDDEDFRTFSKSFAYNFGLYEKVNGNPVIVKTLAEEVAVGLSFKEKAISESKVTYDPKYTIPTKWEDEKGESGTVAYADVDKPYIFRKSIAELHQAILDKELANLGTSDEKVNAGLTYGNFGFFGSTEDEIKAEELYNINLMGIVLGKPYTTSVLDNELDVGTDYEKLLPDVNTPVFLGGGSDGTMVKDGLFGEYGRRMAFEDMVITALGEYANPNSPLRNPLTCPSTCVVDTGFSQEGKKALHKVFTYREDICVLSSPQYVTADKDRLDESEEIAVAEEISRDALLYPDSTFYGTSNSRCSIYGGTGEININGIPTPVPLTLHILNKFGKYMGAKDGVFKSADSPDEGNNKIIDMQNVLPNPFKETLKEKAWKVGMNYPEPADTGSLQFSSFQTVYPDDNSVMNSTINSFILATCIRQSYKTHAKVSGNSKWSKAQLRRFIIDDMTRALSGRFDGRATIEIDVVFTEADNARGFSWTVKGKVGLNVSKTVQFFSLDADRMSENLG